MGLVANRCGAPESAQNPQFPSGNDSLDPPRPPGGSGDKNKKKQILITAGFSARTVVVLRTRTARAVPLSLALEARALGPQMKPRLHANYTESTRKLCATLPSCAQGRNKNNE